MRSSLAVLLALALLMTLFIPAIEAATRRRGRGRGKGIAVRKNGGGGRGRQQGRKGRLVGGRAKKQGRRGRQQGRRGRTNYDSDAGGAAANPNAVDGGGEELYNGCDWKTAIGDFLTFCKWRKWCADEQGITDFGPYGGVPEECPAAAEDGADDAGGAGGEEAQAEPAGAD